MPAFGVKKDFTITHFPDKSLSVFSGGAAMMLTSQRCCKLCKWCRYWGLSIESRTVKVGINLRGKEKDAAFSRASDRQTRGLILYCGVVWL